MEKGKHPVYQYWPWMLAAATVLLAAWAVCETLAIFATDGYTRELAGRALGRLGWGAALWVVLAMVGRRFRPAQLRIPPRRRQAVFEKIPLFILILSGRNGF